MIQNAPKRIYLQVPVDSLERLDFDDLYLSEVSWSDKEPSKGELEYISAEEHMQTVTSYLDQTLKATAEIEKLKSEVKKLSGNIATMLVRSSELRSEIDRYRNALESVLDCTALESPENQSSRRAYRTAWEALKQEGGKK